jgi:hypothetical protein
VWKNCRLVNEEALSVNRETIFGTIVASPSKYFSMEPSISTVKLSKDFTYYKCEEADNIPSPDLQRDVKIAKYISKGG